ncbi:hypothetical protein V6N13_088769 [Hibiscus sabdariffa]
MGMRWLDVIMIGLWALRTDSRDWVTNSDELKSLAVAFYTNIFMWEVSDGYAYQVIGYFEPLSHAEKTDLVRPGVAGVWDQVRHHAIWNVGNGEVIDFWRSPWVADIGLLADWLIFTDYSSFGFHSFEFYGSNEWGLDLVAF